MVVRLRQELHQGLGQGLLLTVQLEIDKETRILFQTRPAFSGNLMATIICLKSRPQMCIIKPKVITKPKPDYSRVGKVIIPNVY